MYKYVVRLLACCAVGFCKKFLVGWEINFVGRVIFFLGGGGRVSIGTFGASGAIIQKKER